MTTKHLAIALFAAFAVSACSQGDTPAEHSSADRAEGHTSSSSGLPAGRIAEGEKLAGTKGAASGQSCVDCHGAEGNAPIDATYPKLAGQYHDYIAHSLQMYRDGDREHALMSNQAKGLNDQQIADLAAYFGSRTKSDLHDLHNVH
ncbi:MULTISPECIES: cytochrome c [unclassified Lysobacter]|uniref:c-type cytochrome n=1 Tax=unclassified Lysobacter TaxID=2635362 RepID=UPI0006F88D68|nr:MULTISPECIES: cytochrome c [unclassified Lysobacter]KQZ67786.1 cytochrome C biogenesis protein CcsA [Lysobacter sp. Root559]KRA80879.1 cytochrome C biogenesis protein CcsA [Lysobacter sp. Root667]KRC38113.1 cytochrome C biogenesis protein CcsA [Lysobacter sp. Root76]KRD69438.1 cytochrome C biogenesis protein CcsA [Lysobacter sp. Root96]